MKKGKKYLWVISLVSLVIFSCGKPVVMEVPTSAFLSMHRETDYTAKTSHSMNDVQKWYNQMREAEKANISINVKGENGEDYYIAYPTPLVKNDEGLSSEKENVAGHVLVNHIIIAANGTLTWNGEPMTIEEIYDDMIKKREKAFSETYVFINVDKNTSFADYLKAKNILYKFKDYLAQVYFDSSYMTLPYGDKEKIEQLYVISEKEYFFTGDK